MSNFDGPHHDPRVRAYDESSRIRNEQAREADYQNACDGGYAGTRRSWERLRNIPPVDDTPSRSWVED